jgi:hypothetical protein
VIVRLITFLSHDTCIYWDETSSSEHREFIFFFCHCATLPPSSPSRAPTCHRCRESRSLKLTSPRGPARIGGHIRFLESAVATARWTSSSLYASVRRSPSTVCLVFCCAIASADNLTVRMSILSLLLVLMFLLLLAQESSALSQILMLVINHSSLVYIVVIIVGINLCVTKLLLYTTVAAAAPP